MHVSYKISRDLLILPFLLTSLIHSLTRNTIDISVFFWTSRYTTHFQSLTKSQLHNQPVGAFASTLKFEIWVGELLYIEGNSHSKIRKFSEVKTLVNSKPCRYIYLQDFFYKNIECEECTIFCHILMSFSFKQLSIIK